MTSVQFPNMRVAVFCLLLRAFGCRALQSPRVEIEGGLVSGSVSKTWTGRTVYGFEGIPYAAPPVGELRFQVNIPSVTLTVPVVVRVIIVIVHVTATRRPDPRRVGQGCGTRPRRPVNASSTITRPIRYKATRIVCTPTFTRPRSVAVRYRRFAITPYSRGSAWAGPANVDNVLAPEKGEKRSASQCVGVCSRRSFHVLGGIRLQARFHFGQRCRSRHVQLQARSNR